MYLVPHKHKQVLKVLLHRSHPGLCTSDYKSGRVKLAKIGQPLRNSLYFVTVNYPSSLCALPLIVGADRAIGIVSAAVAAATGDATIEGVTVGEAARGAC